MTESLLTVSNLETWYGPVMALRGVSLSVSAAEIVTILGSNGAGKTTLLRSISGVLESYKGDITLYGKSIQKSSPEKIVRQGIAHVPQGREVFPLLSVRENLLMGAYTRKDRNSVNDDLHLVYQYFPILAERNTQRAGTLSGGQQQMLAIGRGLMARPGIMLLDEPGLGLSPRLVTEIYQIIERLNRDLQVSMLIVEQNATIALEVANRGYVMELGRIVYEGASDRLLQSKDIKEFFLGSAGDGAQSQKRWKRKKTWR